MFTLTFDTDNAAMRQEDEDSEETVVSLMAVSEMVHDIATRIESGDMAGKVRDVNGNTVGAWSLTDD